MSYGESADFVSCIRCRKPFDAKTNRVYELQKQATEGNPRPAVTLLNAIKEFENYQLVKCPSCGEVFNAHNLKVLGFFSPRQVVYISLILNGLFLMFLLIWIVRGMIVS